MSRVCASALVMVAILSGCGPRLGEHSVTAIDAAADLPAAVNHSRKDSGYVVIHFAASRNLDADDINALYAKASHCDAPTDLTAFGPFSVGDRSDYLPVPNVRKEVHEYLVYMPFTGEIWGELSGGKTPVIGQYDLLDDGQDICIYLEHTGFPIATRTQPVRVSGARLRDVVEASKR